MSLKTEIGKQFCKYCKGELFNSIEIELEAHGLCINELPSCDKCRSLENVQKIRQLVNYQYQYLCMKCVIKELERRTNSLLSQIQGQYSLEKYWNMEGKSYKVTCKIQIEESE